MLFKPHNEYYQREVRAIGICFLEWCLQTKPLWTESPLFKYKIISILVIKNFIYCKVKVNNVRILCLFFIKHSTSLKKVAKSLALKVHSFELAFWYNKRSYNCGRCTRLTCTFPTPGHYAVYLLKRLPMLVEPAETGNVLITEYFLHDIPRGDELREVYSYKLKDFKLGTITSTPGIVSYHIAVISLIL